jgi:hypothetical protein
LQQGNFLVETFRSGVGIQPTMVRDGKQEQEQEQGRFFRF